MKLRRKVMKVKTGSGGDSAGKAFEIHVAKHIGHILKGGHPEDHYPEHFSDESGDSPKHAIKKLHGKLGKELHDHIDHHARRMAHHIVGHLKNSGHELDHTARVHWTSKPKDLERLTGKEGIKGTADITVSHKGKHHGFSLKYSTSGSKPSLRSPGINDLNKSLKASHGFVYRSMGEHKDHVEQQVGHLVGNGSDKSKHAAFKALPEKHKGKISSLVNSKELHRKLAGHYSDSFNKLKHHEKADFIRKMIDAEKSPTIKPYRASYDAHRGTTHITNPTKDFDEQHKTVKKYEAEHVGSSFNVYAHHHNGDKKKITSVGIKNKSSSPYAGIGGRVGDVSSHKH